MKIISLNTYAGHFFAPLLAFITEHAPATDVFCFQEILTTDKPATGDTLPRANLFAELTTALPDFHGFFALAQQDFNSTKALSPGVNFGNATFVKKNLQILKSGEFFIYRERNSFVRHDIITLPHLAHYVQLSLGLTPLTICNVHGTSEPGSKIDTPERLAQSHKILDFVNQQAGEKIITGDFNLLPDTASIKVFEQQGLCNLVRDYGITSTRGSLHHRIHPQFGPNWQEFADYMFVSSGIRVNSFSVPDLPISDHLPLIAEIDYL